MTTPSEFFRKRYLATIRSHDTDDQDLDRRTDLFCRILDEAPLVFPDLGAEELKQFSSVGFTLAMQQYIADGLRIGEQMRLIDPEAFNDESEPRGYRN